MIPASSVVSASTSPRRPTMFRPRYRSQRIESIVAVARRVSAPTAPLSTRSARPPPVSGTSPIELSLVNPVQARARESKGASLGHRDGPRDCRSWKASSQSRRVRRPPRHATAGRAYRAGSDCRPLAPAPRRCRTPARRFYPRPGRRPICPSVPRWPSTCHRPGGCHPAGSKGPSASPGQDPAGQTPPGASRRPIAVEGAWRVPER